MEALDVSGFFCGGCPGKSSDSAEPRLQNRSHAGNSQNTHKGSLCAASGAQVGASMIWIAKSLCAGHLDRPRFSCSPSLTLQLFRKKADCTELRENIWEVGDRHITADDWLPLLMYKERSTRVLPSPFPAARPEELLGLGKAGFGVPISPAPTSLGVTLAFSWTSDSAQGLTGAEISFLPPYLAGCAPVTTSSHRWQEHEATAPDQHLLITNSHFQITSRQHTGKTSSPSNHG